MPILAKEFVILLAVLFLVVLPIGLLEIEQGGHDRKLRWKFLWFYALFWTVYFLTKY